MVANFVPRPALRYFGGKFRLAPWILSFFPPHITYFEPFGGAASVLLSKEPSYHEVYNDLDGEVVNFFNMLREQPDDLIRAIALTPYARAEQRLGFQTDKDIDNLERARRLYVRCWQSHGGGRTQWRTGWRYETGTSRGRRIVEDWNKIDHLDMIVARLKNVQIECDSALEVIKRFDTSDTLYYLDPPYLSRTRSKRWREKAYQHEMSDEEHIQLAKLLHSIQGMAIISGKPSELYQELYAGWEISQRLVPTDFQSRTIECLWISPKASERQPQLRMFSEI